MLQALCPAILVITRDISIQYRINWLWKPVKWHRSHTTPQKEVYCTYRQQWTNCSDAQQVIQMQNSFCRHKYWPYDQNNLSTKYGIFLDYVFCLNLFMFQEIWYRFKWLHRKSIVGHLEKYTMAPGTELNHSRQRLSGTRKSVPVHNET